MPPKPIAVWMPFAFSVALGAIVMVANIYAYSKGGSSDAGMPAFLCFLPMAFFFAATAHRQTQEYVKALEARVSQLEADRAAA